MPRVFLECKGLVALDVWLLCLWASPWAGKLWVGLRPLAPHDEWSGEYFFAAGEAIGEMAGRALAAAAHGPIADADVDLSRGLWALVERTTVPLLPSLQLLPPAAPVDARVDDDATECLRRHSLEPNILWQLPGMCIRAGLVHSVAGASAVNLAHNVLRTGDLGRSAAAQSGAAAAARAANVDYSESRRELPSLAAIVRCGVKAPHPRRRAAKPLWKELGTALEQEDAAVATALVELASRGVVGRECHVPWKDVAINYLMCAMCSLPFIHRAFAFEVLERVVAGGPELVCAHCAVRRSTNASGAPHEVRLGHLP
jgi:hypothetical protein